MSSQQELQQHHENLRRWIDGRRMEWQSRLQPHEGLVMSVYYGVFLGMRPWVSMVLFYFVSQLLGLLVSGNVSFLSLGLSIWLAYAMLEYGVGRGLISSTSLSNRVQQVLNVNRRTVLDSTGFEPLLFEELCQALSIVEYRMFALVDWIKYMKHTSGIAYITFIGTCYLCLLFFTQLFFSERTLLYLCLYLMMFLPALHHYQLIPKVFNALQPFTKATERSLAVRSQQYPQLFGLLRPSMEVLSSLWKEYQSQVSIPDEFWSNPSPASVIPSQQNTSLQRNESEFSVNTMNQVLPSAAQSRKGSSIFSTAYWFGGYAQEQLAQISEVEESPSPSAPAIDLVTDPTLKISNSVASGAQPYNLSGASVRKTTKKTETGGFRNWFGRQKVETDADAPPIADEYDMVDSDMDVKKSK